jgi:hypothetical protein
LGYLKKKIFPYNVGESENEGETKKANYIDQNNEDEKQNENNEDKKQNENDEDEKQNNGRNDEDKVEEGKSKEK